MPAAIQNLLQKPVQKAIPKPAADAGVPSNRESFDQALKDARKPRVEERPQPTRAEKPAAKQAAKATRRKAGADAIDDNADASVEAADTDETRPPAAEAPAANGDASPAHEADETPGEKAEDPSVTDGACADATVDPATLIAAAAATAPQGEPVADPTEDRPAVGADSAVDAGDDDVNEDESGNVKFARGKASSAARNPTEATGDIRADAVDADAEDTGGEDGNAEGDDAPTDATPQSIRKTGQPKVTPLGADATDDTSSEPAVKKTPATAAPKPDAAGAPPADLAALAANLPDVDRAKVTDGPPAATDASNSVAAAPDLAAPRTSQPLTGPAAAKPANAPPELRFARDNHDTIVTSVRSQLLPHGGQMEIRLDPPELGALKVMVEMRDGVLNATFQTSNEQATQLLSHSLNQLKSVLESQGVNIDRLQVQQAPKSDASNTGQNSQQNPQDDAADQHAAQQEQQRKELLKKMWQRLSGSDAPLDFLA